VRHDVSGEWHGVLWEWQSADCLREERDAEWNGSTPEKGWACEVAFGADEEGVVWEVFGVGDGCE